MTSLTRDLERFDRTAGQTHVLVHQYISNTVQGIVLLPKQCSIGIWVNSPKGIEDHIVEAAEFEVTPNVKAAEINAQKFRGAVVPTGEITKLEPAIAALARSRTNGSR